MEAGKYTERLCKAESENLPDLSGYAPPFLREIRELAEIWRVESDEIGRLESDMRDLFKQAFVTTATWGLVYWEGMYGIKSNPARTYEQHREVVTAKMRGEVDVIEDSSAYEFVIRFVGTKGIPSNMEAFANMLEDIKPAHLTYRFLYRYTVWNDLQGRIWNDLIKKTWNEVRTMKEDE